MVTILSAESIAQYQESLFEKGMSPQTVRSYTADLRVFLNWLDSSSLTQATSMSSAAARFLNATRQNVAPKTTLRRLTSLRSYAAWTGSPTFLEDYRAPTPARAIPHPVREGIDGWRRMIAVARTPQVKALFALLALEGLRVSEARSIEPRHFDFADNVISVRGKGDKTREIPLTDETYQIILPALFEAQRKGTTLVNLSDSAARAQVRTCARKAGLSNPVSSHQGRSTFATGMLDNGAHIREVQEILGHASLTSTQIYTGVTIESMRRGATFA